MSEPERADDILAGDAESAEREHAKQERLLAELERDGKVPPHCWSLVMRRVAEFRRHPDSLAWIATRYLQDIANQGPVFFENVSWRQLVFGDTDPLTVECAVCRRDAVAEPPAVNNGRKYTAINCPDCGLVIVYWDDPPDESSTDTGHHPPP